MSGSVARFSGRQAFFAAALIPLLLGIAMCLIAVSVDPLDLRPWGLPPRFFDDNYPELVTPKLVRAVTSQRQDVLLVGGSQAMGVTPAELRAAFGARNVFNLSYSLMQARDLGAVASAAVRTPGIKRVVVELPFTAMEWDRPPAATGAGAIAVLNAPWYALPDFGEDIARASLERLSSGEFATSEWRRQSAAFLGTRTLPQNKPLHEQLERGFVRVRASVFADPSALPCGQFAVIGKAIVPLIAEAASRGVELDLYFPPIPPASYPRAEIEQAGRISWFEQVMSFHRCVLLAAKRSGRPNVHVLAIDLDPQIIGDLSNYKDTFHLIRADKFDRLLDDVRTHRFEPHGSDFDTYPRRVSALVLAEYAKRGLVH
jgi:hypothetical protein